MTDAGFFKGTSADQDCRFSDKNKKLMKTMKFADNLDKKIDMKKVKLEIMKPFITGRLNAMMIEEDEVIIEYVFSQLEETKYPDGKAMQIMLTGFLGKTKAKAFMSDLWEILTEAQENPHGIPKELIELKKNEILKKKEDDQRINASLHKSKDDIERSLHLKEKQYVNSKREQSENKEKQREDSSPARTNGKYSLPTSANSDSMYRYDSRHKAQNASYSSRSKSRSRSNSDERTVNRLSSTISSTTLLQQSQHAPLADNTHKESREHRSHKEQRKHREHKEHRHRSHKKHKHPKEHRAHKDSSSKRPFTETNEAAESSELKKQKN